MNNKETHFIIKNNLNTNFKKSLQFQQDSLINNFKNNSLLYYPYINNYLKYIPSDSFYHKNISIIKNKEVKEKLLTLNNIYSVRFKQTKDALISLSKRKWPSVNYCESLNELKGQVR